MRLKILQDGCEESFERLYNDFSENNHIHSVEFRTELGSNYKYGVLFVAFVLYE